MRRPWHNLTSPGLDVLITSSALPFSQKMQQIEFSFNSVNPILGISEKDVTNNNLDTIRETYVPRASEMVNMRRHTHAHR